MKEEEGMELAPQRLYEVPLSHEGEREAKTESLEKRS